MMTNVKDYFYFSSTAENLLFKDLTVTSNGAIIGLCIGVAFITFLYEAIKSLRQYLVITLTKYREDPDNSPSDTENNRRKHVYPWSSRSARRFARKLKFHCMQTVLHMIQVTTGYTIMLIVMNYNAWFIITVVITAALCFYFHEYILSTKALIVPIETPAENL